MFGKGTLKGTVEWLIVCLGNPGDKYYNTRHNAGFLTGDFIAEKCGTSPQKTKFKSLCGDCFIGGKRALIMKPKTFMNLSVEAVVAAANFYKISVQNILVICDDVALPLGKLRVRRSGSDGGHNGLKSIIGLLGSASFPRIKIGIGGKPHPDYN